MNKYDSFLLWLPFCKYHQALTYTCYQMYARMETGISPEYIQFKEGEDFVPGLGAPHYLLRPEAIQDQ